MKIGIDCRFWSQTGVGRYTRNLVLELQKIDKKNQYVLFVLPQDYDEVKSLITNPSSLIIKTNVKWHSLAEQIKFPSLLKKYNLDLVHFPYFSHPIFYNRPFVVTIHDLIINHFPTGKASTQPMSLYVLKWLGYQRVLRHAVKKSKKIIVPLQFVKNDLSRTLGVSKDKIEVTPEGFDLAISKGKISKEIEDATKIPYFLYVGNAYPHKNLEKLIEGFYKSFPLMQSSKESNGAINGSYIDISYNSRASSSAESGQTSMVPKLVLVGKDDYFYKRLEKKKFPNLIFLHNVSDSELYHLCNNSIAAVSASLMEGFGLLPLEAFGCRTIPVVSNIPAFREVCGDTAIYFNPQDADDIAKKLIEVSKLSKDKRENLIKKGKEILPKFSWSKMAKQTLGIYEEIT